MEEILASIRKIISDDASSVPATPTPSPPEHGATEPDVLDLTHEIKEAPAVPASAPHVTDAMPEESHSASECKDSPQPSAETISTPHPEEGIFSEKTRQALNNALADVGAETTKPAAGTHIETGAEVTTGIAGLSVEAVFERAVKEAFEPVLQRWLAENSAMLVDRMKPAIRDWLDENFPTLLEDAIRSELARVAKSRIRR